jgi:hypothetical protein
MRCVTALDHDGGDPSEVRSISFMSDTLKLIGGFFLIITVLVCVGGLYDSVRIENQ